MLMKWRFLADFSAKMTLTFLSGGTKIADDKTRMK